MHYDYARYLASKRTIDDRSLNGHVVAIVRDRIAHRCEPIEVLELGGGSGTMIDRLLQWGIVGRARYTLVDLDRRLVEEVERGRDTWLHGCTRSGLRDARRMKDRSVDVRCVVAELQTWLEQSRIETKFDLVIAHAVLDLLDVPSVLPLVWKRMQPDATYWFSVVFDGETIFLPEFDEDLPILAAYHRSMDVRHRHGRQAGHCRAGRRLFTQLNQTNAEILGAGSSDWVVFPRPAGYLADDGYFLHHIVHTIETELAEHPALSGCIERWARMRHAQIDACELTYIAHQLDFVGTAGAAPSQG